MDWIVTIIVLALAAYVLAGLRVTKESERFAVFSRRRFVGLKGPGIVLKLPGGGSEYVRISLGAEGEVQSNELIHIAGVRIPFTSAGPMRVGTKVRIIGFADAAVEVEALT
jgi:regulator of protease activity HflC (stomatin/prohibitin superfamily)